MSDNYLWDKSGEPDPEVQRLEVTLRPLRHAGRPLDLGRSSQPASASHWRRVRMPVLLVAAALVFAAVLLWPRAAVSPGGWSIESASGSTTVSGGADSGGGGLVPGVRITTGPTGRVRLGAAGVGSLELGPESALRVVHVDGARHWFALDRGFLTADISAPPGAFAVETPAVRAVDLGCRYTIEVGPDGSGLLRVALGWVALVRDDRESLVPAGAMCAFRPTGGAGTPYFEGAPSALVEALVQLDGGAAAAREAALDVVLRDARDLDALTLWHLLSRLEGASVDRVFDRLDRMTPAPAGVTRELVRARDAGALAAWWAVIGLGDLAELRAGLRHLQ